MNRDGSIHNRDTEWNTFVKELSWQEACVPTQRRMCPDGDLFQARNERLENGDVLVISSDKGIEHAAIYLGSDLYFEKTGAKSDTELYRMVPFDEIANTYRDPELRYRYRRPKKDATLPPHSSAFQESQHEVEEAIWNLMPAELKSLGAAPFWQPEVGDSRDLGIYLSEQRTIVFDRNNRARWAEP
jgi:cell wall-associated NlpC family hydrolase